MDNTIVQEVTAMIGEQMGGPDEILRRVLRFQEQILETFSDKSVVFGGPRSPHGPISDF